MYLGKHLHVQRQAAIKVLTTALTRQGRERFLFEARTLASLAHPHIVVLFDFDFTQRFAIRQHSEMMRDIPFLVMEYAPGGSLKEHYPRGKQVPLVEVVRVIGQVASALQFAHDCNIMHRDVKPANILLNARGEVLLSDFGLAMFQRSSESLLVGKEGTPYYMAPEQWLGKPCYESDQYALGVIAYEWLYGYRPFEGNRLRVAMAHMSDMPRSLHEVRLDVPRAVGMVVARAMAKEPMKRYGSVQEFADALKFANQQGNRSDEADEADLNATVRAFFPVTLPSLPVVKSVAATASLQVSRKIAALAPVERRENVGARSVGVGGSASGVSSGTGEFRGHVTRTVLGC